MNFEDIKSDMKISFDWTKKVSGKVDGTTTTEEGNQLVKISPDDPKMPVMVEFKDMSNIIHTDKPETDGTTTTEEGNRLVKISPDKPETDGTTTTEEGNRLVKISPDDQKMPVMVEFKDMSNIIHTDKPETGGKRKSRRNRKINRKSKKTRNTRKKTNRRR
jgi:hypothetical protein